MNWSDRLAARNETARAKLLAGLPEAFPNAVRRHALDLRFIPESPSRAVAAYWRAHPLRADRLARALAGRSGAPAGWTWRVRADKTGGLPDSFRVPPAPYREAAFARGPGFCRVCGQPVFRLGWHADPWRDGRPNRRAAWHAACVAAWTFWNAPSGHVRLLKRVQRRRCALTDKRLLQTAEVDHRTPLFRVWREQRGLPWPELLAFWGAPNLQVVNRTVHRDKCASEARDRAHVANAAAAAQPSRPSTGKVSSSQYDALAIQPLRKATPVRISSTPIAFST